MVSAVHDSPAPLLQVAIGEWSKINPRWPQVKLALSLDLDRYARYFSIELLDQVSSSCI